MNIFSQWYFLLKKRKEYDILWVDIIKRQENNMFRFDTHVHTDETSHCGKVPGEEMVKLYAEAGYSGFVMTDHYNRYSMSVHGCQTPEEEVETFYAAMMAADEGNPEPISYGLNSKLMRDKKGNIVENVWKVGGMYSSAIEEIIFWLKKAEKVANPTQKEYIKSLIKYYRTGDLKLFDE